MEVNAPMARCKLLIITETLLSCEASNFSRKRVGESGAIPERSTILVGMR